MKNKRLHIATALVILLGINSVVIAADTDELFRKNSILSDKDCDDATSASSRIFFYIRMVKETYNNICALNKINCETENKVVKDLVTTLSRLEKDALSFELEIVKKDCVMESDVSKE